MFEQDLAFILGDIPFGGEVVYTSPLGRVTRVSATKRMIDQDLNATDGEDVAGVSTTLLVPFGSLPELRRQERVVYIERKKSQQTFVVKDFRPAYSGRMHRLYVIAVS